APSIETRPQSKEKTSKLPMSIPEIKSRLSILTVLSHYDLASNANGMIKCPFHNDAKASMKVYTDTNTVYCFGGSCRVSHLDVIDFIMQMDGSTKREAILKAKEWAGEVGAVSSIYMYSSLNLRA
ncbi:MAG: CHC2 zinc finger domain-containing protein, partial [Bacteroidota bacterium]